MDCASNSDSSVIITFSQNQAIIIIRSHDLGTMDLEVICLRGDGFRHRSDLP